MDADPNIDVNSSDITKIVLSYLVHNCYKDTLESFIACTGEEHTISHVEDLEKRKQIHQFALNGNALEAIKLTEEYTPGLLDANEDLHIDLLSLHFVGLIRLRKTDEALEFANSKMAPFGKEQRLVQKLEDCAGLLAYQEPEKSPLFHLLSPEHRHHVANSLNRAILAHTQQPSYSAMERLIQQTTVVRQYLNQEFNKDGHHQPFSLEDFLKS
ncbi:LisH and RanBPM domains containing protein [Striga hermonthica]|uniref:LisH and RanBPM domains containing protein n=1 Tax=Striga hermonthica TaxID=68872 RepID=A0A9N7N414_STRHE|nr:LisH and RanBPM domains containing protein [Striga hermonthica]